MTELTVDRVDAATGVQCVREPAQVTVIEVCSTAKFQTALLAGSNSVPLGFLGEHSAQFASRLDSKVVAHGRRCPRAANRITAAGPSLTRLARPHVTPKTFL